MSGFLTFLVDHPELIGKALDLLSVVVNSFKDHPELLAATISKFAPKP